MVPHINPPGDGQIMFTSARVLIKSAGVWAVMGGLRAGGGRAFVSSSAPLLLLMYSNRYLVDIGTQVLAAADEGDTSGRIKRRLGIVSGKLLCFYRLAHHAGLVIFA